MMTKATFEAVKSALFAMMFPIAAAYLPLITTGDYQNVSDIPSIVHMVALLTAIMSAGADVKSQRKGGLSNNA